MHATIHYVERDVAGEIVGLYRHPQPGFAEEELAADHPNLIASAPAWSPTRGERQRRLAACDWTQLPDAPLDNEVKAAWAAYRQQLRDLPATAIDPTDIVWPEEPAP